MASPASITATIENKRFFMGFVIHDFALLTKKFAEAKRGAEIFF